MTTDLQFPRSANRAFRPPASQSTVPSGVRWGAAIAISLLLAGCGSRGPSEITVNTDVKELMYGANANSPKFKKLREVSDMKCIKTAKEHYTCLVLLKENRFINGMPHLIGLKFSKSTGKWIASPAACGWVGANNAG